MGEPERRPKPKGRGAGRNPKNRFERITYEPFDDDGEEAAPQARTQFLRDRSRSIIARNESPDIGFDASINPYRGCEHGCVYCYARPFHEYLGLSSGLDFESVILVKEHAAQLLRAALMKSTWVPRPLALSGVTDPYQPVERHLRITRAVLEVLAEFLHPVRIVTKNHLVTRDSDLLLRLARHGAVSVGVSISTLDPALARTLEPRTSTPARKLEAVTRLRESGIPAGVLVAPVIPGLTDQEIPSILRAAADAGATFAVYEMLRLPHAVAELFDEWLAIHMPGSREKILGRIRDVRGDKLNDPRFGYRMRGEGAYADHIATLFETARRRFSIPEQGPPLNTAAFRRPDPPQLSLFTANRR